MGRLHHSSTNHHGVLVTGISQLRNQHWRKMKSVDLSLTEQKSNNKLGVDSKTHQRDATDSDECTLSIINDLNESVVLCWVDFEGRLRNFYTINDRSIEDGSVHNRHEEYTCPGHCFVCFKPPKEQKATPPNLLSDLHTEQVLFVYIPHTANGIHTIHLRPTLPADTVTNPTKVNKKRSWLPWSSSSSSTSSSSSSTSSFFAKPGLKTPAEAIVVTFVPTNDGDNDNNLIDTTLKHYEHTLIAGFHVLYEPGVFEDVPGFAECFETDVKMLRYLLPEKACVLLQTDTPIYVNKSLFYGTKAQPIHATSCCFHPLGGGTWLRKHGLSMRKEGAIEIGSATHYLSSRKLWGIGGILVHEFAHAYHNKCLPGGYEHAELRQRYEAAMRAQLYDCVEVHCVARESDNVTGEEEVEEDEEEDVEVQVAVAVEEGRKEEDDKVQKKIASPSRTKRKRKTQKKAYACANVMEFFAELSTAFLYQEKDEHEYNKWYPHNYHQLLAHDPETCRLLELLWHWHDTAAVEDGKSETAPEKL